jgi:hypothetical protein
MSQELNIGNVKLPLSAVTKTFGILAKRGAGKSYTGAVMAEEFFKNNIPFVVFDPIDVWFGLRFDKNGKDKGLPIVVFGVEHADIPLTRDMGIQIAQAIVKDNVSCVISTFGLPKVAQRHLITEFSEEMLRINNTPRHIFIEEAHEFVPQRISRGMERCFNAVSNLVVMGRNRGLGVTLINQRGATINKDVLTQIDTLLAFQNTSPQDRKALSEWVEHHSAEGDFDAFMGSLPHLPKGEGWIWSPEFMNIFQRIKIRKRETFHPDREKLGYKFVMPILTQFDVQSFINKFTGQMKQPKADEKIKKDISTEKDSQIREREETYRQQQKAESQVIISLKNDYEARLIQKDIEIRNLNAKLNAVANALNSGTSSFPGTTNTVLGNSESVVSMWVHKLGNSGASRILQFLHEKSGMKFTKNQIGLATRLSSSSGSFSTYMTTLRRNKLIIDQNGEVWINPDLYKM